MGGEMGFLSAVNSASTGNIYLDYITNPWIAFVIGSVIIFAIFFAVMVLAITFGEIDKPKMEVAPCPAKIEPVSNSVQAYQR
jgi:hypothetical protein